jgi:hypothetical protein
MIALPAVTDYPLSIFRQGGKVSEVQRVGKVEEKTLQIGD